jgi:hypothetical protein
MRSSRLSMLREYSSSPAPPDHPITGSSAGLPNPTLAGPSNQPSVGPSGHPKDIPVLTPEEAEWWLGDYEGPVYLIIKGPEPGIYINWYVLFILLCLHSLFLGILGKKRRYFARVIRTLSGLRWSPQQRLLRGIPLLLRVVMSFAAILS